jgi:hypothetical protein
MIFIEVCHINGLYNQNFNSVKCVLKLRQAKAFPNSDVWIRVNPNYVKELEAAGLIRKSQVNKNFVQLTEQGKDIQIFNDTISMTLNEYFAHESNIDTFIEEALKIAVTATSYKIMHNICHSCNKVKKSLNHIVDEKGNDGMYCNQCLNTIGYTESLLRANFRRKEARYDFSIRPH